MITSIQSIQDDLNAVIREIRNTETPIKVSKLADILDKLEEVESNINLYKFENNVRSK